MKDPSTALSKLAPHLIREWHPTKNETLTPDQVSAGSHRRVWWKCEAGPDHEWQTTIANRTTPNSPTSCPYCSNQKASVTNSLISLFPQVAKEWHPTKNGTLTPDRVVPGSNKRVWWQCPKGPDHQWQTSVSNRTRSKIPSGCPCCAGKQVSVTNSLASCYPELVKEWHPSKNGVLTPNQVLPHTHLKVWWQCLRDERHVWLASPANRLNKNHRRGCPFCAHRQPAVAFSTHYLPQPNRPAIRARAHQLLPSALSVATKVNRSNSPKQAGAGTDTEKQKPLLPHQTGAGGRSRSQ